MFGLFVLVLALATHGDARGSTRETVLATFNAALVGLSSDIEARAGLLIEQILKSDADIFCLQEVWRADIQRLIYSRVKEIYPHTLSAADLADTSVSSEPACTESMMSTYLQCRAERCVSVTGIPPLFEICGLLSCLDIAVTIPETCLICLSLEFFATNQSRCLSEPASNYDRTYGLMFLSTKELKNAQILKQNNQSQFRGILTATVDGVGDLLCTHLSAIPFGAPAVYFGPPLVSPLLYSSYVEQQYDEILNILAIARSMRVPILMGDMNTGPAIPGGVVWEIPLNYGLISAHGFINPYLGKISQCTWCVQNARAAAVFPNNLIIDHVFITLDSFSRAVSAERIFDNAFTAQGVPISDHYGVQLTLSNIRMNCNAIQKCRYYCQSEIKEFSRLQAPDFSIVCRNYN